MITPTGGHGDMHGYRRDITKATEGGGLGCVMALPIALVQCVM